MLAISWHNPDGGHVQEIDLPRWPPRGYRRKLDQLWFQQLESHGHGLVESLGDTPDNPPLELHKAIEEFNNRLFWECHETLEPVWLNTPYPLRLFYHAIIKIAVGFHHMSRHNDHGARLKLSDGVRLLVFFRPSFFGVRTDLLCGDASVWLEQLEASGPIDWRKLDALSTPRICTSGELLGNGATAKA